NRGGAGGNFFNPANLSGLGGTMTSAPAAAANAGTGSYSGFPGGFPYLGYGTYIPGNMGNLYGSAQVIDSLSKYMTDVQQARLMDQQVRREKLETRRRELAQRAARRRLREAARPAHQAHPRRHPAGFHQGPGRRRHARRDEPPDPRPGRGAARQPDQEGPAGGRLQPVPEVPRRPEQRRA